MKQMFPATEKIYFLIDMALTDWVNWQIIVEEFDVHSRTANRLLDQLWKMKHEFRSIEVIRERRAVNDGDLRTATWFYRIKIGRE